MFEQKKLLLAYIVAFILVFMGVLLLLKRFKRKARAPLDFVFLRAPGESLRKEIQKRNDLFYFQLFLGMLIPLAKRAGRNV